MKCRIELHSGAQKELTEAFQWYEESSPGLGIRFIEAVNKRLNELSNYPDRYAKRKSEFRKSPLIFSLTLLFINFFQKRKLFLSLMFFIQNAIPD